MKGEYLHRHRFLLLAGLFFSLSLSLFFPRLAYAATRTWDGGGADNNWSTCANWDTDTCPVSADTVVFDTTSTKDSTVDASFAGTITSMQINSGYTGTLTLARNLTLSSTFTQAAGSVSLSGNNLSVSGSFTISGGTYDSTTGTTTFSGTTATIDVLTTQTFNDLAFASSFTKTISSGDTLVVNGLLLFNGSGAIQTGTIEAKGDIRTTGPNGGTAVVLLDTAGDQTITSTNANYSMPALTINKPSGTVSVTSPGFKTDAFTLQSGTFSVGSANFSDDGAFTISGGTYDAGTGTTTFSGSASVTIDVLTTQTFNNLAFTNSLTKTISSGDTLVVNGLLLFSGSGAIQTGTIEAKGDIRTTYVQSGNAVVLLDTAGDQTITSTNVNYSMPTLTINKPSGTVSVTSPGFKTDAFTLQSGTFSVGSANFSDDGAFTISGGTYDAGTGTTTFSGAGSATIDVNTTQTFNNLAFTNSLTRTISSGDTLVVNGLLLFSGSGAIQTGTIEAKGDIIFPGTQSMNSALTFTGSNTQNLNLNTHTSSLNATTTVNKTGGSVTLLSAAVFDVARQSVTIQSGTLDLNGNNLTVSGTGHTFTVKNGGNLTLQGGEYVSTSTLEGGATITYNGSGSYSTLAAGSAYQNLVFSGSGSWATSTPLTINENFTQSGGTFTASATSTFSSATSTTLTTTGSTSFAHVAVSKTATSTFLAGAGLSTGNVLLSSGTLDASAAGCGGASCNISLSGNWINTGGTFVPRTGTVTLSGANQTIFGTNTFYNLVKTVVAAATLFFEAGKTQTIGHTWQAQGAAGQLLSLRSTSNGSQWSVDPQGTRTISYLDVKDSNNVNATQVETSGLNVTDSLNNTNWHFNAAPGTPSSLAPSSYVDGSFGKVASPTLTFTTSDADGDNVRYQIQIDDSSDFSSPVVDYTSTSAAAGASSFTVGQAAGSGSYTAGNAGQSLSDASYYWRVRAFDPSFATSSWATANSGSIAFKVDATAPSSGTVTLSATTTTSLTGTLAGASDAGSGLSATPYLWYESATASSTGATTTTSWALLGLTPNTQYSLTVGVSDAAGNTATTSAVSGYTLAQAPSSAAAVADSDTQLTLTWGAGQNPAGTQYRAINTTTGESSGWITTTTWIESSLSADTAYSFGVIARNGDGIETATTTASASTDPAPAVPAPSNSGGGGGGVIGGALSFGFVSPGTVKKILNTDAGASLLIGPSKVKAGEVITLSVLAYNGLGALVGVGGDTVEISVTGANSAYPTVVDYGDGTYVARYLADKSGTDTVTAFINGQKVRHDSDKTDDGVLAITIQPASGNASKSPGQQKRAGDLSSFPASTGLTGSSTVYVPPPATSTAPSTTPQEPAPEPFALQSGLTTECYRAFSWNRQESASIYRRIGTGHETLVAQTNALSPWYIDVDALTGTSTYRFVFEQDGTQTVVFDAAQMAACAPSTSANIEEQDVDHDGNAEQFIDGVFQDTDGSSVPLAVVEDGLLIDTSGDGQPDTYWHPTVGISPVILAGDRLYIVNGSLTKTTMYKAYDYSTYQVLLRTLGEGSVALAASATSIDKYQAPLTLPPLLFMFLAALFVLIVGVLFGIWWLRNWLKNKNPA